MDYNKFNRTNFIDRLKNSQFDIVIIGGGATGLGIAIDASSRGLNTLLLEQSDFAKGTSGRSTKLIHGGIRYLKEGRFKLVFNALYERGILLKNASHLVKKQSFIIPCYNIIDKWKYLIALKVYDFLSGKLSLGKSQFIKKNEILQRIALKDSNKLIGGIEYFDARFDDSRLAINLARTAIEYGAILINYFKVTRLVKQNNIITGITAIDIETSIKYNIACKFVINATGVFVDDIINMDTPRAHNLVVPSQGIHIVLKKDCLKSETALMIPSTTDGRVLFAIPWYDRVLVGTTDEQTFSRDLEPVAHITEIEFILSNLNLYLKRSVSKEDILSVFAGLRPLIAPKNIKKKSKEISRDHKLIVSKSGLITITGGKWTTYRKMAEETVDKLFSIGNFTSKKCITKKISIHGNSLNIIEGENSEYGSDKMELHKLINSDNYFKKCISSNCHFTIGHVIWAVKYEMARTVEDVLARRCRLLFLDAAAAIEAAPLVAKVLADQLGFDDSWQKGQIAHFNEVARNYLVMSLKS